jgi:replicative DNA helicase
MSGYAEAALLYLDRGWPSVLPVHNDYPGHEGTLSLPSGFTGRSETWPSREQVTAWCAEHPDDNLGLRLPDGVIGLDVDAYDGKLGLGSLTELVGECGPLPRTWTSTARARLGDSLSGIRLYRVPTGLQFNTRPAPGIDIVQWWHRFVRAWPSTNPRVDQLVEWWRTDGVEHHDAPWLDWIDVELSPAWVERLQQGAPRTESNGDRDLTSGTDLATRVLVTGLSRGERDEELFEYLRRIRQYGYPEVEALVLASIAWEQMEQPEGDHFELGVVLEKVRRLYATEPGGFVVTQEMRDWTLGIQQDAEAQKRERLVTGGDWALDEPEVVPAIWGEGNRVLWAEGEGFMLNGHQGTGKTTIAQQLVLHRLGVRHGGLLGLPVAVDERPVLYLAMDRPRQAARSFRRMVSPLDRDRLNERLRVWTGPLPFNLILDPTRLAAWAQELVPSCGLVVVDSVKDLCPGIAQDDVGSAVNLAWQRVIASGTELLLLHHGRKASQGATRETSLDGVYGSTWLTSGLGSVVVIEGEPGDTLVRLHHRKQPAEEVGPLDARHDHVAGQTVLHAGSVLELLRTMGRDHPGLTLWELTEQVLRSREDRHRKKIERELKDLAGDGLVEQVPADGRDERGRALPSRWRITPMGLFGWSPSGHGGST